MRIREDMCQPRGYHHDKRISRRDRTRRRVCG